MITSHPDNITKPLTLLALPSAVSAANLAAAYAIFADAPKGTKVVKFSVAAAGVSITPPFKGQALTPTATSGLIYAIGTHEIPNFEWGNREAYKGILQSGSPTMSIFYFGD